jgi:hypothetical protein
VTDDKDDDRNSNDVRITQEPGISKTVTGQGSGESCALCGIAIAPSDTEYEVVWSKGGSARRSHFHVVCYELWWSQQA